MRTYPTQDDARIITAAQKMLDEVSTLRASLYTSRHDCACDGVMICAHHAEVYNRLEQVADALALVINAAARTE